MQLKPQDLLTCLKLAVVPSRTWTYPRIAGELHMSASEVNGAVRRALVAGLLVRGDSPDLKPEPMRSSLLEFLEHGVRYAFPVQIGGMTRGMPTAHSAPPLNRLLRGGEEPPLVWPDPRGEVRGQGLVPLYRTVPEAARDDAKLYELLALTDALREGRTRERKIAIQALADRLGHRASL